MTIQEDASPGDIDIIRFQNFGWWDFSAEEGEPVRSKLIHYDRS